MPGHGRERFVYASTAGVFTTAHDIGSLGERWWRASGPSRWRRPRGGTLRGLTRGGVQVAEGTKVIEVDPRGLRAMCAGLGERPGRIAQGVAQAVQAWRRRRLF
jgi:xanthine dehydrogenase accessory factor